MSYIQSYQGTNPYGETDELCHIVVDGHSAVLRLSDCDFQAGEYTLQFWIKSTAELEVSLESTGLYQSFKSNTTWKQYIYTFKTNGSSDGSILLGLPTGVYYLYHVKLEAGSIATEWVPARDTTLPSPINTPEPKKLYRLSEKYTDKIGCDNGVWYIERNTELVVFKGSEAWSKSDDNTYVVSLTKRGSTNEILPIMCDRFADVTAINNETDTILSIEVDTSIADSLDAWITWLASNPVNVLMPARLTTTILANYLQTSFSNISTDGNLSISFDDANVYNMTGAALVKPIVLGTVNESMAALINNGSDDEIGFIYQIHCKDEVVNPVIYLTETNEHIKLNATFKKDDIITIDTRKGRKAITKTYQGVDSNIINSLDNTSKWLQLQSGYNHLIQSADNGAEDMDSVIIYTNEYEGV